jgi:hypothetical protein
MSNRSLAIAHYGPADIDLTPVVKLFTPDAQCTWLLTERANTGASLSR